MLTKQYMSKHFNSSQAEFKLRVESHPLAPDIYLLSVSKSYAVIETTSNIHYLVTWLEINLCWIKSNANSSIFKTKLAKHIPSPSIDLTLCCKKPSKEIAANYLRDWFAEVYSKRNRRNGI